MKILKELLGLTNPDMVFEAEVPIELADVVAAFPKHHGKAFSKLWGTKRLVWHGKRFFEDGTFGPAYKEALAVTDDYIKDGYNTDANLDISGTVDGEDYQDTVTWDIEFSDTQEVYLGYDPKKDKLYLGYDAWATEDEFNSAFDKAFEEMTGEEFNNELPVHEAIFNEAWREFKHNFDFWGLIFEISMDGDSMTAEEAMSPMPHGFYHGVFKMFKQQHPNVIDLRRDR
jgi:hypothetical protein